MLANKGDASRCQDAQKSLTECAHNAMPFLKVVKAECRDNIRAYDTCLHDNRSQTAEGLASVCTIRLRELADCTEKTRDQYHKCEKEERERMIREAEAKLS